MSLFGDLAQAIKTHQAPGWASEPIRRIANRVAGAAIAVGVVITTLTQLTTVVPAKYQSQFSAFVLAGAALAAGVAKYAGAVARSKVFSTDNHRAIVKAAAKAAQVVAAGGQVDPASVGVPDPVAISL